MFVCFFNSSVSSSVCKLPIRSEIHNCTVKNTNKVSIITIIMLPLQDLGFNLNKREFRDAVKLRYDWPEEISPLHVLVAGKFLLLITL